LVHMFGFLANSFCRHASFFRVARWFLHVRNRSQQREPFELSFHGHRKNNVRRRMEWILLQHWCLELGKLYSLASLMSRARYLLIMVVVVPKDLLETLFALRTYDFDRDCLPWSPPVSKTLDARALAHAPLVRRRRRRRIGGLAMRNWRNDQVLSSNR
jgi:hypothetical protein